MRILCIFHLIASQQISVGFFFFQFAVSEQFLNRTLGSHIQVEVCSYLSFVTPLEVIHRSPFIEIYYPRLIWSTVKAILTSSGQVRTVTTHMNLSHIQSISNHLWSKAFQVASRCVRLNTYTFEIQCSLEDSLIWWASTWQLCPNCLCCKRSK